MVFRETDSLNTPKKVMNYTFLSLFVEGLLHIEDSQLKSSSLRANYLVQFTKHIVSICKTGMTDQIASIYLANTAEINSS